MQRIELMTVRKIPLRKAYGAANNFLLLGLVHHATEGNPTDVGQMRF